MALLRVEKLTKQSVLFYEADLGDQKALDRIFSSVKIISFMHFQLKDLMIIFLLSAFLSMCDSLCRPESCRRVLPASIGLLPKQCSWDAQPLRGHEEVQCD